MIRLVGFSMQAEREWFRLLQTVQGVGTKVALAILSTLSSGDLANAIALQDKAMIGRASGVGKKLAERIVLELKDKVPAFAPADIGMAMLRADLDAPGPTAAADAVSALVNLGYGQVQAGVAVSAAMRKAGDDQPTEKLIRLALRELAMS
jgi:Holliday junction DNA helicase RuvA